MQRNAREELYIKVYRDNLWGCPDSASGFGSAPETAAQMVRHLRPLLDRWRITSVFDCPCGDWAWMKNVPLEGIDYLGGDIVADLVETNQAHFGKTGVRFTKFDLIDDTMPTVDAILLRDVLIHFKLEIVQKVIRSAKESGIQYILTTHHGDINALHVNGQALFQPANCDLGGPNADTLGCDYTFRPLNFCAVPFNWPSPLDSINEGAGQWGGHKELALWKLSDLSL